MIPRLLIRSEIILSIFVTETCSEINLWAIQYLIFFDIIVIHIIVAIVVILVIVVIVIIEVIKVIIVIAIVVVITVILVL